jgi:hypothetical protein
LGIVGDRDARQSRRSLNLEMEWTSLRRAWEEPFKGVFGQTRSIDGTVGQPTADAKQAKEPAGDGKGARRGKEKPAEAAGPGGQAQQAKRVR